MKIKKIILTGATALTVAAPVATVVSCGFGGADSSAAQKVTMEDVATQVTAEKLVENKAANTTITVGVRNSEKPKWDEIAKKFNAKGKGKVQIKSVMGDPGFAQLYSTKAASGGMFTIDIADANIVSALLSGKADYAKPIYVPDFTSAENKDLYNVLDDKDENNFEKVDINQSHLKVVSNDNGVQFAFPLGYTQTSLYANWRMISKDLEGKIYAYVPTKDGHTTLIDKDGNPTEKLSEAVVLAPNAHYDTIQAMLNDAGYKPEKGTDISSDKHHSAVKGNWLGWGPGNLYQRIYSITKSISIDESKKTPAGLYASTPEMSEAHSMVFKEQLGNFELLASAGLEKDGVPMFDKSTSTLTEKGFEKQATRDGFSEGLANYFWKSFGGYMSKNSASFINNQGIAGGGYDTGEVEPFEYKQVMFMQNAKWAERWANGNWHKSDKVGSVGPASMYHGANNMITSGDVVKFSLPYGQVMGDSLIISSEASDTQSLVAKRFLKYIEQQKDSITYTPDGETAKVTETIAGAVNHNFLSAYRQNADKQKSDQTMDLSAIKSKMASIGVDASQIDDDAVRVQKSALKGFDLGYKDPATRTVSDVYNGMSGTVWKNTDTDFFSVIEGMLTKKLEYFKDKGQDIYWTYDKFKAALKDACVEYYNDRQMG